MGSVTNCCVFSRSINDLEKRDPVLLISTALATICAIGAVLAFLAYRGMLPEHLTNLATQLGKKVVFGFCAGSAAYFCVNLSAVCVTLYQYRELPNNQELRDRIIPPQIMRDEGVNQQMKSAFPKNVRLLENSFIIYTFKHKNEIWHTLAWKDQEDEVSYFCSRKMSKLTDLVKNRPHINLNEPLSHEKCQSLFSDRWEAILGSCVGAELTELRQFVGNDPVILMLMKDPQSQQVQVYGCCTEAAKIQVINKHPNSIPLTFLMEQEVLIKNKILHVLVNPNDAWPFECKYQDTLLFCFVTSKNLSIDYSRTEDERSRKMNGFVDAKEQLEKKRVTNNPQSVLPISFLVEQTDNIRKQTEFVLENPNDAWPFECTYDDTLFYCFITSKHDFFDYYPTLEERDSKMKGLLNVKTQIEKTGIYPDKFTNWMIENNWKKDELTDLNNGTFAREYTFHSCFDYKSPKAPLNAKFNPLFPMFAPLFIKHPNKAFEKKGFATDDALAKYKNQNLTDYINAWTREVRVSTQLKDTIATHRSKHGGTKNQIYCLVFHHPEEEHVMAMHNSFQYERETYDAKYVKINEDPVGGATDLTKFWEDISWDEASTKNFTETFPKIQTDKPYGYNKLGNFWVYWALDQNKKPHYFKTEQQQKQYLENLESSPKEEIK